MEKLAADKYQYTTKTFMFKRKNSGKTLLK